jgi:hypothetical protein
MILATTKNGVGIKDNGMDNERALLDVGKKANVVSPRLRRRTCT